MPIYYSSKDEILDTKNFTYFNSGRFSNVYKNDDILLKIYLSDVKYNSIISKKIFLLLKKYNIPNLVRLKDYYHAFSGKIEKMLPIDAYTMDYVKDKKVELLDMDKKYMNDITKMLEETLEELSKKHILIEDSHEGNILFTENGVTILDVDQFVRIPILTQKYIYQLNKEKVVKAINDTIKCEYYDNENTGFITLIDDQVGNSLEEDISCFMTDNTVKDSAKKNILSI